MRGRIHLIRKRKARRIISVSDAPTLAHTKRLLMEFVKSRQRRRLTAVWSEEVDQTLHSMYSIHCEQALARACAAYIAEERNDRAVYNLSVTGRVGGRGYRYTPMATPAGVSEPPRWEACPV